MTTSDAVAPLRIEAVEVTAKEVEARLRLAEGFPARTSAVPGIAEKLAALLPGIARHRCDNPASARFVDEAADTEWAHLAEHVAVELMALAGSPRTLRASTSWDFARDGAGVYHVRLAFDDDLVALGALDGAVRVVGSLMSPGYSAGVDVGAEVERLRGLREGSSGC